MTRGRWIWLAVTGVVVIVTSAVLAPLVSANRFREPLRTALEKALTRKVEFDDVRYQGFPALGLSARNVVVNESPEFGLDAFAYVDDLQVTLRWSSLITGRFEVASVRLVDASVNFARTETGGWNFQRLLRDMTQASTGRRTPELLLRNGRINFRTGVVKSPFYMNTVDLDLSAGAQEADGLDWSYDASPARTDRAEQGFGRFTGSGRWRPAAASGDTLDVEMALERSALSEVLTLMIGRDPGLQGRVGLRARLFGPLSSVRITGSLEFEDLDRSSGLFSSFRSPRWSLPLEGTLDLPRQSAEIRTGQPKEVTLPFAIEVKASNLLTRPQREARFRLNGVPAQALVETAHRLGSPLPDGLKVTGSLLGLLTLDQEDRVAGQVTLSEGSLQLPETAPLSLANATIHVDNSAVHLDPVRLEGASGSGAEVSGEWSFASATLGFRVKAQALLLEELRAALRQVPQTTPIALVDQLQQGVVSGVIEFRQVEGAVPWAGDLELSNTRAEVPGLAFPVQLRRASLRIKGDQWWLRKMQGTAGQVSFSGELIHTPAAKRSDRFALLIEPIDASSLEDLLRPTVVRRGGFLERTLRFRSSALPAWLRSRHAEGLMQVQQFDISSHHFENLIARVYWDGAQVEIPEITARWAEVPVRGQLSLRLDAPEPAYHLRAQVENLAWKNGKIDFDLDAQATGLGSALLGSALFRGDFHGRGLDLDGFPAKIATGSVDWSAERSPSRLRLRQLEVQSGTDLFTGQGTLLPDGRVALDLSSPTRPARVLFDPRLK